MRTTASEALDDPDPVAFVTELLPPEGGFIVGEGTAVVRPEGGWSVAGAATFAGWFPSGGSADGFAADALP
jgi:hypothetical protein